jgi:serine/threonine protein kinase
MMVQLAEALEYFHKQNWIHRDICPRNVLLDQDSQVKLIDFGLVVPNTAEFRKPGNRTGTANYMAPELIKRQKTDHRIDIFSFSVTCYEMVTKRFPWDSTGFSLEMVLQHINRPATDIRDFAGDIDDQLADAIMKGLSLHPSDRWSTVSEMLQPLRAVRRRLEVDEDDEEYEDADKYVEAAEQQQREAGAASPTATGSAETTDGPTIEAESRPA